jgi:hypothetical protein
LHHLVETTLFLLHVHRKDRPIWAGESSLALHNTDRMSDVTVTVTASSSKKYGPHTPNSKKAHHTVTLELWSGRWWSSRGLLWDRYRKFCLLTVPQTWKCASSVNNKTAVRGTFWRSSGHNIALVSQSLSLNS